MLMGCNPFSPGNSDSRFVRQDPSDRPSASVAAAWPDEEEKKEHGWPVGGLCAALSLSLVIVDHQTW